MANPWVWCRFSQRELPSQISIAVIASGQSSYKCFVFVVIVCMGTKDVGPKRSAEAHDSSNAVVPLIEHRCFVIPSRRDGSPLMVGA